MKTRLSDELTLLTTRLMMCGSKREIINLSGEFGKLIERVIEQESHAPPEKSVTATIKFTKEEVAKMASTFKKEFIGNGLAARITKRESGKNTYCYEIRYRRNGYNISASSNDLLTAKKKFLEMTKPENIHKYQVEKRASGLNLLEEVFQEWYNVKKGTITQNTLQRFWTNFYSLPEKMQKSPISIIRTGDIDKILKEVAPRKYEELRTLFNGIFKYAIASGIISNNPVALIPFKRAERVNRDSLSTNEILAFFDKVRASKYDNIRQGAYLLYFFGLRPCEVDEETHVEGDFLIARNRKRKNGKIEYKKIPIPKNAHKYIDWDKPLVFNISDYLRNEYFKEILDGKTSYCFRHTFATTCQQYVRPDIVDIWMGDSPDRLVGRVYTHFSDEFMKNEMEKVTFITK